jgi:ProP effector
MKTPTVPSTGRQGPTNSNTNTNSSIAAAPSRQRFTVAPVDGQTLIAVLAELFPALFFAEQWKPHRPLKRGVHNDLIEHGELLARECRVLRWYLSRRMYQVALAAGGPRYDLDGQPAGEVTPDEADHAKAAVSAIEAKQNRKATAARADVDKRKAIKTPAPAKAPQAARPADKTPPAKSGLSLDGLRAAARARREAVT